MDDMLTMELYGAKGYYCSQIIVQMALDLRGESNLQLIRSMHALAGGLGFNGLLCGALIGGACMLGLYAGKGSDEETEDDRLMLMLIDLVEWFKSTTGQQYGGVNCPDILMNKKENYRSRCPQIIQGVFEKCKELLVDYGYDLSGINSED